jgi:hypothetical protein
MRIAVEDWALRSDAGAGPSLAETVRRALRMVDAVEKR